MAETNEPAVKQEELLALLKGYVPAQKNARERDSLAGRYRIQLNQPIPELNSHFAKAYIVRDGVNPEASLYALVYDNNAPLRQKNISVLKEFRHPHLVALVGEGIVEISTLSEARYVCVLERPGGQSLAQWLAQGKTPMSESTIVQFILRPLTQVLIAFNELGISHNRINMHSLYLAGEHITLGECISEPSGFSQDPLFEPIDRALTSAWGKPDFSISTDCYALAIVTLHLAIGFAPFSGTDNEFLIDEILAKGSYHTLALPWDLPEDMQDFFRGLLIDNTRNRWDPQNIKSWLGGRRFNLIFPSSPREASRGFDFAGQVYYDRKSLAHNMFRHWQDALALLFDNKLARWLETSVHKPDVAETVTRIASNSSTDTARSERHNNDLLARIIMVLDPSGPIRLKHLSTTPEGIGLLLAHAFLDGNQEDIQIVGQMIESDLLGFWLEQQRTGGGDNNALIWKLQKLRPLMRMTSLGFGIERCLYDLLPGLPCQSPMLKRYRVSTLADLLTTLDIIAPQKAAQEDYIDRHIAGFITSKLEMGKELRVHELDMVPGLSKNPGLIALKLLMRAQSKAGETVFKGLSTWLAYRLFPLLDNIHKRDKRRKFQIELREKAGLGSLSAIAEIMLNSDTFSHDTHDFQRILSEYKARNQHIAQLKNKTYLARHARMAGRGFAQTIAFTICLTTIYFTLKSYFHF